MAGGLVALLDDIAAIAKLAAASVDDVGAAAGRASAKAAGVVVDDTLLDRLFAEELSELRVHLGEPAWADGHYERAAELLRAWSSLDDLIPFFPIAVAGNA